jgi:hypothetical protein
MHYILNHNFSYNFESGWVDVVQLSADALEWVISNSELYVLVNMKMKCNYLNNSTALLEAGLVRLKSKEFGIMKSSDFLCLFCIRLIYNVQVTIPLFSTHIYCIFRLLYW